MFDQIDQIIMSGIMIVILWLTFKPKKKKKNK
jgi:hypothetical protein